MALPDGTGQRNTNQANEGKEKRMYYHYVRKPFPALFALLLVGNGAFAEDPVRPVPGSSRIPGVVIDHNTLCPMTSDRIMVRLCTDVLIHLCLVLSSSHRHELCW